MRFFDISTFSQCLNQVFHVDIGSCEVRMTLVDMKRHPVVQFPGISREPFSLIFKSDNQVILPQKIYTMSHDSIGKAGIFIVPVGRDVGGIIYEAVFN
jgi:hypothetical protein